MKVLRILEGDMIMDGNYASSPGSEADQYSSGQLRNDGWDMFSETARLAIRERERGQRLELNHSKQ